MYKLLDVVAGQFLTEDCLGVLVLGLVQAGNSGIQSSADDKILLPVDLVGSVSLRLSAGSKANAGDAVAALDGNAVGGEGPLIGQRTADALCLGGLVNIQTLGAPQSMVGIDQSLNVRSGRSTRFHRHGRSMQDGHTCTWKP